MRFRLTINRTSRQNMLPMEYNYFISAFIYKVISNANKEFASFLHNEGYGKDSSKLYKLFCFSRLNFGKPVLWKEKKLFEIKKQELSLSISFDVPEAARNFIQGLFMQQEFYLGDKFNGLDLQITKVESLPEPEFNETMHYQLQTPWVVSYKREGKKYADYLKPEDEMFQELSVKHLTEKLKNTRNETVKRQSIDFVPSGKYKRSGIIVKNGTQHQTRVMGNIFDFELKAPLSIHKMLWNAGVSEKSSSGFGWCEMK